MTTTLAGLCSTAARWLLADGATGTSLFNMGLEAGEAPELWNEQHPEKVRALYDGAIAAGSDLFLTNTFGGNASRLKLHDAEKRVHSINRIAARIAREAADAAGRPVVVAGSMGPTGEIMAPLGPLTIEDAAEMFEEQARGLLDGGADLLWVETISAPEEFEAAAIGISAHRRALVRHHELRHRRAHDDGPDLGRHGGAWSPASPTRRSPSGRTAGSGPPTCCAPSSAWPRRGRRCR